MQLSMANIFIFYLLLDLV